MLMDPGASVLTCTAGGGSVMPYYLLEFQFAEKSWHIYSLPSHAN